MSFPSNPVMKYITIEYCVCGIPISPKIPKSTNIISDFTSSYTMPDTQDLNFKK